MPLLTLTSDIGQQDYIVGAVKGQLVSSNEANYFPLTITFANPVFGAGANIAQDTSGPFTAELEAFDVHGMSLGMFAANRGAALSRQRVQHVAFKDSAALRAMHRQPNCKAGIQRG